MTTEVANIAQEINHEHALARSHAETAIKHAIRCGELLAAKKAELLHGSFQAWIEEHCQLKYSTAARYMRAAKQISHGVEISKLSDVFPSGRIHKGKYDVNGAFLRSDHPIPMTSGNTTLGINASHDCAYIFFESVKHPGFWHDFNVTEGNCSTRPCRPEFLSCVLGERLARRGVAWFLRPHDGWEIFLHDVAGEHVHPGAQAPHAPGRSNPSDAGTGIPT